MRHIQLTKRFDEIITDTYVEENLYHDTYIRADIVAEREEKLIEYAFDNGVIAMVDQIRYAEPPLFCPESDVEAAYYQAGLEKLV